jgi:hypothetical protein
MQITPNKLTISQLLASKNEQFIVPAYQRRYAWGEHQFEALYEDINMLKDNDSHLLGMIILHAALHTAGINRPELVDGQQRMATFIIFLKAFEIAYREKEETDKAKEVRRMLFCQGLDRIERPKIILGDLDQGDLEKLLYNHKTDGLTNTNIINAFEYFNKKLLNLCVDKLDVLLQKLTEVAVIIRLDVGLAQDAYKLFETINNRGLRLTPTDIIKNFLLGHASKINAEQTLENVKSLWSSIIKELDSLDTDDFLRQYICSALYRKVPMSKLILEFKKFYLIHVEEADLLGEYEYFQEPDPANSSDEDMTEEVTVETIGADGAGSDGDLISIVTFLDKLYLLAKEYRKISLAKYEDRVLNKHVRNLNNILSKPTYIFLMKFIPCSCYSLTEKSEVLKFLETLMLRRHVCGKRTSENDDIFAKMCPFIGSQNILATIKQYVQDGEFMPEDDDFQHLLPKHQFIGKLIDRAKFILGAIEEYNGGNTHELEIDPRVHLEHIIPQNITTIRSKEEFGDWETYLGERSRQRHPKKVCLLGNMTLLGEALNIQASNNPFKKKRKSYEKSNFKITQELANQHDFRFINLEKRGQELTKIAMKIWSV